MSAIKRVIAHWSVTKYAFNTLSAKHYHFMVSGDGEVKAGDFTPEDNIKPVNGKYAAHTLNCNTGSVGIACMAMYGAKSVKDVGAYPITERQFEAMCKKIAELCIKYDIAVSTKTVLSHAEVQPNLGITQRGKWDIAVLPYKGLTNERAVGDYMRERVVAYMGGTVIGANDGADSDDSARIRWLQKLLDGLGYSLGTPDGVVGDLTRAATELFQRDYKLPVSRELDEATVIALRKVYDDMATMEATIETDLPVEQDIEPVSPNGIIKAIGGLILAVAVAFGADKFDIIKQVTEALQ